MVQSIWVQGYVELAQSTLINTANSKLSVSYAGCPEGAYRVLKRVDFFFTRDALKGHTVSKNGSISFLRGMP